jgi:alkaline phosphatase
MNRALAAAALLLSAPAAAAPAPPRSVIFVMADGLSWGQLQLARDAARLAGRTLAMERMMDEGHTAYCGVTPLGALVPESGASASAYATGRKIANRSLSQLPDGKDVETILELARRRGLATGLVTTARLTHATPAAFLVHRHRRDDEFEIAADIERSGVDVLLGGGRSRFPPSVRERARADGYAVLDRLPGVLPPGKTLGLLADETFPYSIDRAALGPDAPPTLETMTRLALARLGASATGFALVVNARLIDEASHYHDAAAMLAETADADRSVAVALEFLAAHPDVELVVASHHDTGGMGMSWRINPPDLGGEPQLRLLAGQRASFHAMLRTIWERSGRGKTAPTPALALEVLRAGLAPEARLTEEDARSVVEALRLGPKALPFAHSPAAHAIARALERQTLILWSTGTHTSALQPCFGLGPGSERLHGLLEDTDVFQALRPAADFR